MERTWNNVRLSDGHVLHHQQVDPEAMKSSPLVVPWLRLVQAAMNTAKPLILLGLGGGRISGLEKKLPWHAPTFTFHFEFAPAVSETVIKTTQKLFIAHTTAVICSYLYEAEVASYSPAFCSNFPVPP